VIPASSAQRHLLNSTVTANSDMSLWVISGHVGLHEKASALPLKADLLRGGETVR